MELIKKQTQSGKGFYFDVEGLSANSAAIALRAAA